MDIKFKLNIKQMTYENFLKKVKYTNRTVFIPIINQYVLRSSFIKDGKYIKKLEEKFLKAVYDKREFRKKREDEESALLESLQRLTREAE